MVEADQYIGVPWCPNGRTQAGVDCWGLVWLYFAKTRGVELPSYSEVGTGDAVSIAENVAGEIASGRWQEVDSPADGDWVLMSHANAPRHCGVFAAGHVLHVTGNLGSVFAHTLNQLKLLRFGRIRFMRYIGE